jgi:hypothetical protein
LGPKVETVFESPDLSLLATSLHLIPPLLVATPESPPASPLLAKEHHLKGLIATHDIKKLVEEEPGFEEHPLGIYELLLGHTIRRIVESNKLIMIGLHDDELPELAQIRKTVPFEPEAEIVRKLSEAQARWRQTGSHLYLTEGFEAPGHYSYRAPRLTRAILEEIVMEEQRKQAA